ncbi:hypothetical protein DSM104443_01514 [Usitatibacter rugosus]|uniref:Uncharacterized protein n=1 Tax=Usitatibacter rugosus TaxID=2732067 RepID=A0A6M4GSZ6_9PROT|nr:hypothetical protein [Usitatibacter rugosus]QJR10450.1 hypothetical protein DSM104443_01514 [Usitatibacter rugosus]
MSPASTPPVQALTRKLFWLAFWVIGFAVSMSGLLLYFKYQAVFTGLQRDRVLMVATEIDGIAEKNLSLGQDFWEIATLQDVIERRRKADQLFTGIDVAGKDGKIAYATDMAKIGSPLPPEWIEAFSRNPKLNSLSLSPEEALVVSGIRNSFGQPAGYAVIRYSRGPEREAMTAFTRKLVANCLIVFTVFGLGLFAILVWIERGFERALSTAAAALDPAATPAGTHALSGELALIQKRLDEADRGIGAIEGSLGNAR